ncbi:hypothetical protein GCM10009555_091680 [Acrocarpospora macrocephala]|uniref:Uncharacterized protein n=1 Tax=Acrocarpospora macrocephala TaxID=150177 RepID=A0A5M3WJN2_9ACTN|nr:hypothetical protein Amac_027400 [Acrocarpospora macrocephala]
MTGQPKLRELPDQRDLPNPRTDDNLLNLRKYRWPRHLIDKSAGPLKAAARSLTLRVYAMRESCRSEPELTICTICTTCTTCTTCESLSLGA